MTDQAQLLPGTLDLLILKAVSLGPLHGYGISRALRQTTDAAIQVEAGSLYPALQRLELQGLLAASAEHNTTGSSPGVGGRPGLVCNAKPEA